MRYYRYMEYDGQPIRVRISEDQIIREYYGWWSDQMQKAGKREWISRENCIADFCAIHWAMPEAASGGPEQG